MRVPVRYRVVAAACSLWQFATTGKMLVGRLCSPESGCRGLVRTDFCGAQDGDELVWKPEKGARIDQSNRVGMRYPHG